MDAYLGRCCSQHDVVCSIRIQIYSIPQFSYLLLFSNTTIFSDYEWITLDENLVQFCWNENLGRDAQLKIGMWVYHRGFVLFVVDVKELRTPASSALTL